MNESVISQPFVWGKKKKYFFTLANLVVSLSFENYICFGLLQRAIGSTGGKSIAHVIEVLEGC